ncbi:MAG: signal peptidase I [Phycisphaerales bacterium JB039]
MPLPVFLFALGAFVVATWALFALGLWLGARAWRLREIRWRQIAILIAGLVAVYVSGLLLASVLPKAKEAIDVVTDAAFVVIIIVMFFYWAAARWRRTLAGAITALILANVCAAAVAVPVNALLFEAFRIPTNPMAPTVIAGDAIVVDHTAPVRRWDVVAYIHPPSGTTYLHRVAGLPGEVVEIVDGTITIDGRPIDTPPALAEQQWAWLGPPEHRTFRIRNAGPGNPLRLGLEEYFVVGDNAAESGDSRTWAEPGPHGEQPGAVRRDAIIGVARLRYWPLQRFAVFR